MTVILWIILIGSFGIIVGGIFIAPFLDSDIHVARRRSR